MKIIWIFVILGIMYTIATIVNIYFEELTTKTFFLAGVIGACISLTYQRDVIGVSSKSNNFRLKSGKHDEDCT